MKYLMRILSMLIIFIFVKAQVNTNRTILKHTLINVFRGRNNDYSKRSWFRVDKISTLGRFMLCVDVLQKVDGIRVMGGYYITHNNNMELHNFDLQYWYIETDTIYYHALRCPLHTIKFENLNNEDGKDFYITEGANKFCVYMMKRHENLSRLVVIAEVCGIMVNIRYNRTELDEEIKSRPEILSKNFSLLEWPELAEMSDEKKFTICVEFCEKNAYYDFYTNTKTLPVTEKGSSLFKIVNYFQLVFSDGTSWKGGIQTLFCPMNEIRLPGSKTSFYFLPPFHLVNSINSDCVYKIKMDNITNPDTMDEDYEAAVSIQAELCGIFGPKHFDLYEIQKKFVERWTAVLGPSFITLPSPNLLKMHHNYLTSLCLNVIRKVYERRRSTLIQRYQLRFGDAPLKIIADEIRNIQIETFKCPPIPEAWNLLKDIYLLESVNLGCVYVLSNNTVDNRDELVIKTEVCDVHPISNSLDIQSNPFSLYNCIVDFE